MAFLRELARHFGLASALAAFLLASLLLGLLLRRGLGSSWRLSSRPCWPWARPSSGWQPSSRWPSPARRARPVPQRRRLRWWWWLLRSSWWCLSFLAVDPRMTIHHSGGPGRQGLFSGIIAWQIMSQRAYARHRGVSVSTVQKAIESGRISPAQRPDRLRGRRRGVGAQHPDARASRGPARPDRKTTRTSSARRSTRRRGRCGSTTRRASPRSSTRRRIAKLVSRRRGPGRRVQQVPAVPRRDAQPPRPPGGDACRRDRRGQVLRDPHDRDPEGAE